MTSDKIDLLIKSRNGELSSDEILLLLNAETNPQIDHIIFENGLWRMWDNIGREFVFRKRN